MSTSPQPSFPAMRMRRGRSAPWIRAMLAEHVLTPADFIWPLFVAEGRQGEEPIATLPGVSRWTVDRLADLAREALNDKAGFVATAAEEIYDLITLEQL